jgi:DNA repair protein RecN (Recombination protein N)
MSRFLLALKACFSQVDAVGTMVFDEVDVGVSGRVAQAIAEKLHQLGQQHQVLCVTHQPIVAAMADSHFRVDKQVIDPNGKKRGKSKKASADPETNGSHPDQEVRTVVRVILLNDQQRREELAQIAGGKSDQEAIAFADSLLSQAASTRSAKSTAKSASGRVAAKTKPPSKLKTLHPN